MMKSRSSRMMGGEQATTSSRIKPETSVNGANNQQASAAQARKRRSSINVYDQPSSLNSRLRQLETDMLRLDEDRTKLFDDTHSALAQYELKLSEIHAILKSRQDNVEKYVEDMKLLLQAKEDFEKQTKQLSDKHDRIHEKFMHRETIISREIKLLKNKFEILEKNRQFRTMFQKSNQILSGDSANDDLIGGSLDESGDLMSRKRSETTTMDSLGVDRARMSSSLVGAEKSRFVSSTKGLGMNMSKLRGLTKILAPLFGPSKRRSASSRVPRRNNKVSSISEVVDASAGQVASQNVADQATSAVESMPSFHVEPHQQQQQQKQQIAQEQSSPIVEKIAASDSLMKGKGIKEIGFLRRLFR